MWTRTLLLSATSIFCIVMSWHYFSSNPHVTLINLTASQFGMPMIPYSSWHIGQQHHVTKKKRKLHGYFLHITDMHIDEDYTQGTTVDSACHELPKALAQKKKSRPPSILADKYGTVGEQCDAPVILAQETLDWISKNWNDKLDFVIWTGDNAKHDWDKKQKRKRRDVYALNQHVTDMVLDTFWNDKIPVIPSFGNNDVFPHNQIGGPDVDGDLLLFYERLWRPWMPADQRALFRQGGYFIVEVAPGIHAMTLNSMYFYTKNEAVRNCLHPSSPAAQQMQWFEQQLKKARKSKQKIYVIGHVPPSPRDYKGTCLSEYLRIATEYTDVVMGHFFAHMNIDHFLLFDGREPTNTKLVDNLTITQEDDHAFHTTRNIEAYINWLRNMYKDIEPPHDDKRGFPGKSHSPLVVVQVSPSVLPVYNPSIRIYQYQLNENDSHKLKPHGTLLGYQQYFANLTKWNVPNTKGPLEYELEYSTQETYHMEDLSAESYFQLAKAMVEPSKEGNQLWNMYCSHMLVKTQTF